MYIIYNSTKYPCKCRPSKTMQYRDLPEDFPAPAEGEIALYADDDFLLRKDNTADYLRQTFEDGVLTLTNEPEVIPDSKQEELQGAIEEIESLKIELNSTDYKIIKCSECQMAGVELPYDIVALHAERQAIRDRINELEEVIA